MLVLCNGLRQLTFILVFENFCNKNENCIQLWKQDLALGNHLECCSFCFVLSSKCSHWFHWIPKDKEPRFQWWWLSWKLGKTFNSWEYSLPANGLPAFRLWQNYVCMFIDMPEEEGNVLVERIQWKDCILHTVLPCPRDTSAHCNIFILTLCMFIAPQL